MSRLIVVNTLWFKHWHHHITHENSMIRKNDRDSSSKIAPRGLVKFIWGAKKLKKPEEIAFLKKKFTWTGKIYYWLWPRTTSLTIYPRIILSEDNIVFRKNYPLEATVTIGGNRKPKNGSVFRKIEMWLQWKSKNRKEKTVRKSENRKCGYNGRFLVPFFGFRFPLIVTVFFNLWIWFEFNAYWMILESVFL